MYNVCVSLYVFVCVCVHVCVCNVHFIQRGADNQGPVGPKLPFLKVDLRRLGPPSRAPAVSCRDTVDIALGMNREGVRGLG